MTAKEVILQVARENNTTPERVEAEMRKAIREAMDSKDPYAQMLWKQIAPDGKEPSIDVFLRFCAERLRDVMHCALRNMM